ncbi:uncharacterized protein LOC111716835 isoform X3 [Eurytemora carolleeae]|uniref:uncharacterized protein LOC111716835 isoform X3 n=1 Tax=Eurytemora carolleeae TaxID=1294199 RepID=UPI000C76BED6|nr:uncharacterized protein LOC111716835 isoform X3 [Eurytemora carolleeae]|eukprot:XP_023348099.1 uncharacterized protein LOC111716835 isoform X3 [Eurytemora affinis]
MAALAQESIWFNKSQCDDAERMYFEKLSGAKRSAPVEDDSAHSAADKPASKPDKKEKKKAGSSKKETKPVEKVWSNKADCDDAETKLQERLAQPEYRNPANGECTFIMLKPDAVHRGLVGTIISRFESRGFKLLAAKFMRASKPLLETHYSDLAKKGFFPELIRYMGSGPVVPMVWQGLNAVKQGRVMLGATNPKDSAPGTIRGDFCVDVGRNIIHGSDSVESAEKEIKLWFTQQEISSWRSSQTEWVYEEEELKGSLAEQLHKTRSQVGGPESLSAQIARARQHIKNSLECVDGLVANVDEDEMALASKLSALELENKQLKKVTDDLKSLILRLEGRVTSLEGGKAPAAKPAAEDDDDDVDLFGSDDDNEEVDAEKARITAERLKAYAEKKSKKPALIAKTSVLFDVKPWDDETDLDKMLECCKSIQMDGLVWGASKKVPIGYGIEKLQVMCIVEDEKVSIEELGEKIEEFEDYVQSVDVAAMNKI